MQKKHNASHWRKTNAWDCHRRQDGPGCAGTGGIRSEGDLSLIGGRASNASNAKPWSTIARSSPDIHSFWPPLGWGARTKDRAPSPMMGWADGPALRRPICYGRVIFPAETPGWSLVPKHSLQARLCNHTRTLPSRACFSRVVTRSAPV